MISICLLNMLLPSNFKPIAKSSWVILIFAFCSLGSVPRINIGKKNKLWNKKHNIYHLIFERKTSHVSSSSKRKSFHTNPSQMHLLCPASFFKEYSVWKRTGFTVIKFLRCASIMPWKHHFRIQKGWLSGTLGTHSTQVAAGCPTLNPTVLFVKCTSV